MWRRSKDGFLPETTYISVMTWWFCREQNLTSVIPQPDVEFRFEISYRSVDKAFLKMETLSSIYLETTLGQYWMDEQSKSLRSPFQKIKEGEICSFVLKVWFSLKYHPIYHGRACRFLYRCRIEGLVHLHWNKTFSSKRLNWPNF